MTEIHTNDELLQAFQTQTPIQVWYDGEMADTGPIQQLGLRSIQVNGTHYVKRKCQFYISE